MARLKKAERREQIIENAVRVFAERGMAGARTREIAEACGVNEALLYKHFRGKNALYREAMSRIYTSLVQKWTETAEAAPDGRTALTDFLNLQVTYFTSNAPQCANMIHGLAAATSDPEMNQLVQKWSREQNAFIQSLIERGSADGSLRPDLNAEQFSFAIRGMAWTMISSTAIGMDNFPEPGAAMRFYTGLIKYLAGDPVD
jgi:AcrR family transcriptional regulator